MEALGLVAKSFLDPGDTVGVEGPTYLGAIMAFRTFQAEPVAVPLDDDGLDVDDLAGRLAAGLRPKLLYTIPDHQNPAGVTLAAERRAALVELARRYGFLIVEDVAYRELGFDGSALPSLWSIGADVVLQVATTSKTFFPGVRLGWAAGPAEVVTQLVSAKQTTDQCAAALGQRLFEEYVRRGWIDEQLERSRALYAGRCERLLAALERSMPPEVEWTRPSGGFFSWLTLPVDAGELALRAAADGVAIVPGGPFYPDGSGTTNVRLSFSNVADELIDVGIDRLAALVVAACGAIAPPSPGRRLAGFRSCALQGTRGPWSAWNSPYSTRCSALQCSSSRTTPSCAVSSAAACVRKGSTWRPSRLGTRRSSAWSTSRPTC